jgi:DNA-directed RNA polymerase beta' subunit
MGTATSGYMQRRIVKLTEDIKIQYDGTVRDVPGNIYQVAYGETGIDPTHTVKVGKQQEICDISRLVTKLNMEYDVQQQKKKKKKKDKKKYI